VYVPRKLGAEWLGKGACSGKKKKTEEVRKKKKEGAVFFLKYNCNHSF
jgi:hypothetical protein